MATRLRSIPVRMTSGVTAYTFWKTGAGPQQRCSACLRSQLPPASIIHPSALIGAVCLSLQSRGVLELVSPGAVPCEGGKKERKRQIQRGMPGPPLPRPIAGRVRSRAALEPRPESRRHPDRRPRPDQDAGPACMPRSASPVGLAWRGAIPENNSTPNCFLNTGILAEYILQVPNVLRHAL